MLFKEGVERLMFLVEKEKQNQEKMGEEKRQPELKEFSNEEIEKVMEIVDIKEFPSNILAKIDIENIDSIIDLAVESKRERRQKLNKNRFLNLQDGLEELRWSASAYHKLLCAVNGKEDFEAFYNLIEKFTKEKKIEETDERIQYLKEVTNRQIEMSRILEELFRIDIKRRIGNLKKDERFFSESIPQLEKLLPEINEVLDYFKKEEIQLKLKKIKNLIKESEIFLNWIKDRKTNLVKDKFYNFCFNLSLLRLMDFEDLNREKMKETVEDLIRSSEK